MSEREQLEAGLEKAKEMVLLGEAVKRLQKNRDFKKVFMDTYFGTEPQRLTMMLAAPNIRPEQREGIIESLQAISEVHTFLNILLSEAERAADLTGEYEDELAALNVEEA